jgi:hypothetical protein
MYTGKLVFAQALNYLPLHTFRRCIHRYDGNRYVKSFSCKDQYRCMAFAQFYQGNNHLAVMFTTIQIVAQVIRACFLFILAKPRQVTPADLRLSQ